MVVKRKVIAANKYQQKIRYGRWLCVVLDSGQAFWVWQPRKGAR